MVEITADTHEIEQQLLKLKEVLVSNGAFIHEDLVICCKGGNLTIEAPHSIPERQRLVAVPGDALLTLDHCQLSLNGDDICIDSTSEAMSPVQVTLLEIMTTLYNLTGKIAFHKASTTHALYHHDTELLERLAGKQLVATCSGWDQGDFYLKSFLASRKLGRKLTPKSVEKSQVLMPLIDFFNHHPLAKGFVNTEAEISVDKSTTAQSGNECFVRYGKHDDFQIMLGYGYAETQSPMVASQPMTIDIPHLGVIELQRRHNASHNFKELPGQLRGLERYLPPVRLSDDRTHLMFGSLSIPPASAPRAMRRVLEFFIGRMYTGKHFTEVFQFANDAEQQVIDNNVKFYTDLISDLETYVAKPGSEQIIENVKVSAASQLGKVKAYSFEKARS